ncbi:MAG: hypothetical protein ACYCSI_04585 [Solirubrobacteraceae bacterium]
MTLKNTSVGLASLALALSPALAQASPAGHGKPEGTPGKGKGPAQRSESGAKHAGGAENHGNKTHGNKTHGKQPARNGKCSAHETAYIASGTLLSDTLTKSEHANTYSGQITVDVTRTNEHANAAHGKTETYTVHAARVIGPIAVEALKQGDDVKLIGKIEAAAPKCETTTAAAITISKLSFHEPHPKTTPMPAS